MNKSETLEHLRNAKASHVAWVQKAKFLIEGFKVSEDAIPVDSTQCSFGKWFYGDAQKLNALTTNSVECMLDIEKLHFELHDTYMNIYKIYYDMSDQGILSRFFGKKKKISEDSKSLARTYFKELEQISNRLIAEINRLERRILAIQESELEKVY